MVPDNLGWDLPTNVLAELVPDTDHVEVSVHTCDREESTCKEGRLVAKGEGSRGGRQGSAGEGEKGKDEGSRVGVGDTEGEYRREQGPQGGWVGSGGGRIGRGEWAQEGTEEGCMVGKRWVGVLEGASVGTGRVRKGKGRVGGLRRVQEGCGGQVSRVGGWAQKGTEEGRIVEGRREQGRQVWVGSGW